MHFIHVVCRQDTVFPDDHVPEEHIVYLQVDHIYVLSPGKAQLILLYIHHQRKPLLIVGMPENGITVISPPWVFRQNLIFLPDIVKNHLPIHHTTS